MITLGGINSVYAIDRLRRFAEITGLDMMEQIRITARVLSVSLAHSTQPYGKGSEAHQKGKTAVERDIRKVFVSPGGLYPSLMRADPGTAAAFWNAWKRRDIATMENVLRGSRAGSGLEVLAVPKKSLHEARRGRKGRVEGRGGNPSALVTSPPALAKYIKERQKLVGLTKAGWALAAAATGGTRGIPAWASTRQSRASGGARTNNDRRRPAITIFNNTPWLNEAQPDYESEKAIDIAEEKLLKRMQIIVRKRTGRAFR
jgi:hypothetical protein